MSAGVVIFQILSNDTDVTDIVGSGNDCRVTPLAQYESYQTPFITYREVSTVPNATKSGVSTCDETLIQLDIVADTQAQAQDLADKVRTALDYAIGTYSGISLNQAMFSQQRTVFNEFAKNDGVAIIEHDYRLFINR